MASSLVLLWDPRVCEQVGLRFVGLFLLLVLARFYVLVFVLSFYFIIIIPSKPVCFLIGDRKGVDLSEKRGGESMGGVGAGEVM